jgi:hypothetical protein
MNKAKFLILFFLIVSKIVNSQSLIVPAEGFQTSFTTGNIQIKEDLYNALKNSGLNVSLGLNYSFNSGSYNHEAGLNVDAAVLWNRYGWDNYCFKPSLHYRILKSVGDRIQIGGNLGYSSLYYLNEYFDSHHTYWFTTLNCGISGCYTMPLNSKWSIVLPINLPLIGFVSRPNANRNLILNEPDLLFSDILKRINSNYQFVIMGRKYFEIETGVFLRTRLLSKRLLSVGYKLEYEQTATSLRSQLLTHQFTICYPITKSEK